jgi:ATP-binding cassette subfamily B protein
MRQKRSLLLASAVVATAILRVSLPWPVKWIFDAATSPAGETAVSIGFAAGTIVVIAAAALYVGWRVGGSIVSLIEEISNRVRRTALGYLQFSSEKDLGYHAESASRFIQDARVVSKGFESGVANLALHSATICLTVVVMLILDWKLGLLASFMLPLYWFPTPRMIQGIEERVSSRNRTKVDRRGSISFLVGSATGLVLAIGIAVLLWLGAGMVMNGMLTIGQLSVFLAYVMLARTPMIELQSAALSLIEIQGSREEIDKLLLALDIAAPETPKRMPPRFEGRVGFYNVFSNDHAGGLDSVTLKIRPNRRTAFAGGDASSRQALMRLLLKLEQPESGRVLIDGSDVNDYDDAVLRSQIVAVPIEPVVMDATVSEYLAFGEVDGLEDAMKAALAETDLLEWVESLPGGLNTALNGYVEHLTISRRRLLAMARAAYTNAPILILDDPTRDLDDDEKRSMVASIDRVSKNRTTLIVTDDLRLASRLDSVVFMEDGRIIEHGSHGELIDDEGPYARRFQQTSPGPVLYASKSVQLTAIYEDRRKPENINPFVFLVGCPGSGVSLIKQMLEQHPMLAVANDTHFIPTVLRDSGARGDVPLSDDLVDRARTFPNFDRLGLDNVEVYKAGGMSKTYSEFVTNLYNIFAKKQGKELVVIKAPVYCRDIRLLHDLFPWARYIHVVRDGRDVAMSVLERATRLKEAIEATNVETVPIGASALWWKTMVEAARRDGDRLGNRFYHEIRFEDIVDQPQTAAREISSFLEISHTATMGDHVGGYGSFDSVSNGFQDWRSQMNRADVGLFEALAGDLLESIGYGRGVSEISEEISLEADRCLESWRNQKSQQTLRNHKAASNA